MSANQLIDQIYATPLSGFIRDTDGLVAFVQTLHILAIAVIFGSALALELRVAGMLATEVSVQDAGRRFLPWMWGALFVLALTGIIMIIGEPDRTLTNWVFWSKMGLIVFAAALVRFVRQPLVQAIAPAPAKWQGYLLIAVWIAIIFCGRWIAYVGGA